MPKLVLAGGTGLVGSAFARHASDLGWDVVLLIRDLSKDYSFATALWDGKTTSGWVNELQDADYIVNLAGAPILQQWTPVSKGKIIKSRTEPTKAIGKALQSLSPGKRCWLNISATGYYGDRGVEELTENSTPGTGFLSEVCKDWESAMTSTCPSTVQGSIIRLGTVLSHEGGALPKLLLPTKAFTTVQMGEGHNFMPVIHMSDLMKLMEFVLVSGGTGVYNGCLPSTITSGMITATIKTMKKCLVSLKVPNSFINWSSEKFGFPGETMLFSQKAFPEKALAEGFQFQFDTVQSALSELLSVSK